MSQLFFVFKKARSVLLNVPTGSAVHPASYSVGKKVKQSRYRPGVAQRVPGT
jgi:hypothetical protein